ncbi:LPS-assembly protein LptD [Abditibacteriota bacterium]|nr:LPS-assembly protein LptD [Abditibacteriota bacterium]
MKLSLCLCLSLLGLVSFSAFAQPKKTLVPDAGQVNISNAPDGTATYDGAQKLARITKDVVITQRGENLVVYAQEVVYDKKQNRSVASGQLRVVTRDSTIRGDKLFADFGARQFIISGNVVITTHGKNDGAMAGLRDDTEKKPIRVLCDQVVWEYDTRQATATGNIRISQGVNQGTCNKIVYSEAENVVNLLGNVKFGDEQDRRFRAQDITFYVDNDIVNADSRVIIEFIEKEGMNGEGVGSKTPRPQKARIPVKPMRGLPSDLQGNVVSPPPAPATPTDELPTSIRDK